MDSKVRSNSVKNALPREEVRYCRHVESNIPLALPQRGHGYIQIGQAVQIEMVQPRRPPPQ